MMGQAHGISRNRAPGLRLGLALTASVLAGHLLPAAAVAAPPSDLPLRQELCAVSIGLSGLEREMDDSIQAVLEDSMRTLTAAFPDGGDTVTAYQDSLSDAMVAAKAPVLARVKESCAAAFTVDELRGISAFYESSAGRAWLEKGRTLMRPALNQAIADVVPGVFAETQKRFCARMGGCTTPPATQKPSSAIL